MLDTIDKDEFIQMIVKICDEAQMKATEVNIFKSVVTTTLTVGAAVAGGFYGSWIGYSVGGMAGRATASVIFGARSVSNILLEAVSNTPFEIDLLLNHILPILSKFVSWIDMKINMILPDYKMKICEAIKEFIQEKCNMTVCFKAIAQ